MRCHCATRILLSVQQLEPNAAVIVKVSFEGVLFVVVCLSPAASMYSKVYICKFQIVDLKQYFLA